ncbi:MAG: hypothetical protein DWQ47_17755 [Acidobacteria bacterium]|nr:MAG: hypothetical protein DWQ32_05155 [Acidobacteriota bacterium]REK02122.1 MAG: hypothetical protein DWQ38_07000 [Acidobacteriota bacterium]REK14076.1 MAG: hypothetical protein DWQ43_10845 [Acidobacteriota bacterium]REK42071.1 MAG: hypothetical protein DWQ47_17755 [Acidobacteriota bacterium]
MLRYKWLSTAVLLVSSVSMFGQDANDPVEDILGALPKVEGWQQGETRSYGDARLGMSVGFNSEKGGTFTVFVYDKGITNIQDGPDSDLAKEEVSAAKAEIQMAIELGYYEKVEFHDEEIVALSENVKSRRLRMTLFANGRKLTSEIYVYGHLGYFIKFRATRAYEDKASANKDFNEFVKKVADSLHKYKADTEKLPADVGN